MKVKIRSLALSLAILVAPALLMAACGGQSGDLPAVGAQAGSSAEATEALQPSNLPASLPNPPPTCGYCSATLVHKTPEQMGQFVLDYANTHLDPHGPVQVLLLRYVRAEDFPALGLGCSPSFGAVEQPPLLLAVYKGDIDVYRDIPAPIAGSVREPGKQSYALYIFDMWAASRTIIEGSSDGSNLRQLLNDPALPAPESQMPQVCATSGPSTLHYGEPAPGFSAPPATGPGAPPATGVPWPTATAVSVPPPPVGTAFGSVPQAVPSRVP